MDARMNETSPLPFSPAAAPGSAPGLALALDVSVLRALIGDDDETIAELLADYAQALRELGAGIGQAHADRDLKRIAAHAHRLKSSSRSVGALALGGLCAELETAARAGLVDAVDTWVGRFVAERLRVEACLPAPLNSGEQNL